VKAGAGIRDQGSGLWARGSRRFDYFRAVGNPETDWLDAELDRQRLGLTDIILCEVLQGVALARDAARNYRTLRSRGHTVRKTIVYLIATFCLREQHALLHRDRDFDPFEKFLELSVIHPSPDLLTSC
jgi:predicted nucleic acid-binding protein